MHIVKNKKDPIILDFSGDVVEAFKKLESILCTTPWNRHLYGCLPGPNEDKLMVELLRERAIIIREVYYIPEESTKELERRAKEYLFYLHKRTADYAFYSAVRFFSQYKIDIQLTDKLALFYPDIKAYVRTMDLEPEKLFGLLQKDCCERVIIFHGERPDYNQPEETFYSFELRAPKKYIMERLEEMNGEILQDMRKVMARMDFNKVYNNIIPFVRNEE